MLRTVPGMSYLKTLVPSSQVSTPTVISDVKTRIPPDLRQSAVLLVTIVLNVAFGARPLAHITTKNFAPAVRIHVSARLRQCPQRGEVHVRSLHIRPLTQPLIDAPACQAAEICGTAVVKDHTYAFATRLELVANKSKPKPSWMMMALRVF